MKLIIEVTEDYYARLKKRMYDHLATIADATILDGLPYEERPTGHWIDNGVYAEGRNEHLYICSVCGHRIFADKYTLPQFKGCYCGADMRGKAKKNE